MGGACCSAGAGPTVTLLRQPGDCYSNRVTACPVDTPNPSLWLREALDYDPKPASAAGQVLPVHTLTFPPWEHQEAGERIAESLSKPFPCIQPQRHGG